MKNVIIVLAFLGFLIILCSLPDKASIETKKSPNPLQIEVIENYRESDFYYVKAKITNISGKPIYNSQIAFILYDASGKEIAFQKHYAIRGTEGGLAPGNSTRITYVITASHFSKGTVKSVGWNIEELNFK